MISITVLFTNHEVEWEVEVPCELWNHYTEQQMIEYLSEMCGSEVMNYKPKKDEP